MPVTENNLADVFSYHKPDDDQLPKYDALRTAARVFAQAILDNTVSCADQQAAIRHVRDAVMSANAAVALKGSV